ncbi:COX15/CtaA family protein [Mucilaginibacter boryungensis]|uniref:COX15/CtaA family protein n=1 Tax=Mucilaginibacter boryungensis TaxID=768480 RepID=A0ABR9XMB4_9SPHI|nr:COX15/CtaA family protein [Mucilaginibacter boryungensis]MBE9668528.1 COX15/CtaA family protein [Mucilaginibacter boryungensis]
MKEQMSVETAKVNRQVSRWLALGIGMVIIQILLGGITRLTGSGLSITEWQPFLGALPPLSHAEWERSFALYRQIAQFKKQNIDLTLSGYQYLYLWEWLHREWARLLGVVFMLPFAWLFYRRVIGRILIWPLTGIFLIGILQAIAGWLMVKSGLNDTDVRVSHIRLAVHFLLALILLAAMVWLLLRLRVKGTQTRNYRALHVLTMVLILLLLKQLTYGAFMAGTHAALFAPTWPSINGYFFPPVHLRPGGFISQFCNDPLLIQFVHRLYAYLILTGMLIWYVLAGKTSPDYFLNRWRKWPLLLTLLQILLGIASLLESSSAHLIWYASFHQLNAILLWITLFIALYFSRQRTGLSEAG